MTFVLPQQTCKQRGAGLELLAACIVALCCLCSPAAWSERLDKAKCSGLETEQASLVTAGIKADLERGPDWAKANLPPARLKQIARFIELSEQIMFRCKEIKAPPSKVQAEPKPDKKEPSAATAKGASVESKPKVVRRKATKARSTKRPPAKAKRRKVIPPKKKTGLFSID